MELKSIKEFIQNWEKLNELAHSKISVIEKLDHEYDTARGIENISFYDESVSVTCDDTCMGCYDSRTFSFPLTWLTKTDDELKELVIIERELKLEKERKAKEEKQIRERTESEERQRKEYQRLRAKFESQK